MTKSIARDQLIEDESQRLNESFEVGPLFHVKVQQLLYLTVSAADERRACAIVDDETTSQRKWLVWFIVV